MSKEGDDMSDAERRIVEHTAAAVVNQMMAKLADKETAARVMDVWGGEIDRTIGRGLRRALWYLFLLLAGIAALKFGLVEKLLAIFK
jgi:hypothetical protein